MYGVDAFVDAPLPGNDVEFSADASFVRWDYGSGFQKTGDGLSGSANLRFGPVAVYVDYWRFLADAGTANKTFDRRKIGGGLAFFIKGHADKVTLEVNNITPGPTAAPGGATSNATGAAPVTTSYGLKGPDTTAVWIQAQAAF
jgi:hypothetical protein